MNKLKISLVIAFSISLCLLFLFLNIQNTEPPSIQNTEPSSIQNTESQKLPTKIIFIKTIGELGSEPGQFDWPFGIDFFNEKLYVADTNNNRIQIFSKNLDLLSVIPLDITDSQGIAITDNLFFVTSTHYLIKSFDHTGDFINQFSVTWTRDLVANENSVYVIEPLTESIQVYDHSGKLIDTFEGIFNLHFLNSNDKYLVASGSHKDKNNHELIIIDKEKKIIKQRFSTSPGTTTGSAITENNIFLLDAGILKIYDFNGNLLLEYFIETPGIDSDLTKIKVNDNNIYVLNTRGHYVQMLEIIYE